jgi:capsular exopolysaccharide synthesis family protein
MDQIGRALTKARDQAGIGDHSTIVDFEIPRGHMVRKSLVYSQTRIVPLNEVAMRRNRILAGKVNSKLGDVYRLLRAQILRKMAKGRITTLGVTSPVKGEGATFTAANLAMAIAMDVNQTVLLVDANLRDPSLHRVFGFEPTKGLNDYLVGKATVNECLVNPGVPRLVLLPSRGTTSASAELLSSPAMTYLARELKQRYQDRIIIYDLPPVLSSGDAVGFLPHVEGILMVVRSGAVDSEELRRAVELVRDHNLIGTVLNAVV